MQPERIQFEARAVCKFTKAEIALLMECSARHYDGECKRAGQPGGMIFGLNNALVAETFPTQRLSAGDCDLLCKVLENGTGQLAANLSAQLKQVMKQLGFLGNISMDRTKGYRIDYPGHWIADHV